MNGDVFAMGKNHQYALVKFPKAGSASVTFTYTIGRTNCVVSKTIPVTVGAASGAFSASTIIYADGQLQYLDNTVSTYQWGYDNYATLDSTLLPGATFQTYLLNNPDFNHNYFWVIVTKNGCSKKIYYNAPLAVTNANTDHINMHVFPNPGSNIVHIELDTPQAFGGMVTLTDMTGRVVSSQPASGTNIEFNVTNLPSGCYLITCIREGMQFATTRFIKN